MRTAGSKAIFTSDPSRIKGLSSHSGEEVTVLGQVGLLDLVEFRDGSKSQVAPVELSDVFTESIHPMSAIVETMKNRSNGTHYYSDVSYELLYALDPEWTTASGITRETFRY